MRHNDQTKKMKLLAISIGIVYLWFGILKFFPGLSPAENLAQDTIYNLTFGIIGKQLAIILLAIWEITIGILFILSRINRKLIIFTIIHMVFTFTPLLLFPELSFNEYPFSLTLVGQYIMKNLIIISALLVICPPRKKVLAKQKP